MEKSIHLAYSNRICYTLHGMEIKVRILTNPSVFVDTITLVYQVPYTFQLTYDLGCTWLPYHFVVSFNCTQESLPIVTALYVGNALI